MPAFLGLRTVIYNVDDLERAKAWYTSVLGQEPYFAEPFYVGFNVGGFELGLDPSGESPPGAGGSTAYWGVEEIGAAHARLLELGARSTVRSRTSAAASAWPRCSIPLGTSSG